jgi:hypothetical protein
MSQAFYGNEHWYDRYRNHEVIKYSSRNLRLRDELFQCIEVDWIIEAGAELYRLHE